MLIDELKKNGFTHIDITRPNYIIPVPRQK